MPPRQKGKRRRTNTKSGEGAEMGSLLDTQLQLTDVQQDVVKLNGFEDSCAKKVDILTSIVVKQNKLITRLNDHVLDLTKTNMVIIFNFVVRNMFA